MASLREVFGVSKDVLLSYVPRDDIDSKFKDSYELTDHHIVVFGETKVGKSHLRKKYIPEEDGVIVVDCTKGVNLNEIYTQILYKAGIEATDSFTRSIEEGAKINAEARASLLEFLRAKVSGELSEKEIRTEVIKQHVPSTMSVRLSEELVKSGIKIIVLDDFHYLSLIEQYQLSFDLKMFYQKGIRFIIIGTKISSGYFEKFNGELTQRIDYIDATNWTPKNLKQIALAGSKELNITISDEVVDFFIEESNHIVSVFQMLLFDYCLANNVRQTIKPTKHLNNLQLAQKSLMERWANLCDMYFKKIQDIAKGGRRRKLQLYYYIMKIILSSEHNVLKTGFSFEYLFDRLQIEHPLKNSINHGALTSVLNHIDDLQADKDIFPKVFTYFDKRLSIVDSVFYFILKHFQKDQIDILLPPHDYQIKIEDEEETLEPTT